MNNLQSELTSYRFPEMKLRQFSETAIFAKTHVSRHETIAKTFRLGWAKTRHETSYNLQDTSGKWR